jgi:hypothetical protein
MTLPGGQPSTPPPAGAAPATSGQTPSTAEEKVYELSLGNGRVEKLTEAQLREAYLSGLRLQDYTRKTQEIAAQRAEAEKVYLQLQQAQQAIQARQAILNNPQAMIAEAQRQIAAQQPIDPNQPMTMGQGMEMAQAIAAKLQEQQQLVTQQTQQLQEEAQRYVEDRLQVANYAESINSTLNEVYQQHPILKVRPEMEDILRFKVAKLQPRSLEEAQQAFRQVAADEAKAYEDYFNQRQQQQVAARQTLATQGIEPPGGAAPQPSQPSFRKPNGDLDWNKLKEAAIGSYA